jgi:hypothetical protein
MKVLLTNAPNHFLLCEKAVHIPAHSFLELLTCKAEHHINPDVSQGMLTEIVFIPVAYFIVMYLSWLE